MIEAKWLGRLDYNEAYFLQRRLLTERGEDRIDDRILTLEHKPCYTLGTSSHETPAADIPVYSSDRGGGITYHGPGQVIAYPIFRVSYRETTRLVWILEQAGIDLLTELGIKASRNPLGHGVWVDSRKIASIGLKIRHGISMHGIALNANPDLHYFRRIHPCGLEVETTSIYRECGSSPPPEHLASDLSRRIIAYWQERA